MVYWLDLAQFGANWICNAPLSESERGHLKMRSEAAARQQKSQISVWAWINHTRRVRIISIWMWRGNSTYWRDSHRHNLKGEDYFMEPPKQYQQRIPCAVITDLWPWGQRTAPGPPFNHFEAALSYAAFTCITSVASYPRTLVLDILCIHYQHNLAFKNFIATDIFGICFVRYVFSDVLLTWQRLKGQHVNLPIWTTLFVVQRVRGVWSIIWFWDLLCML